MILVSVARVVYYRYTLLPVVVNPSPLRLCFDDHAVVSNNPILVNA